MLSDFMEKAHIMTRTDEPNAYGGQKHTWAQGAAIDAGFVLKNGSEVGEAKDAVLTNWTILCGTDVWLRQNDVVKRDATGTIFRITGIDRKIPECAEMQFQRFDAEVIE